MPANPAPTATATNLLAIARRAGCIDYDVTSGDPATKKLTRLRLPNGVPLVIQTNNKTPRVWLLPEHEKGALRGFGEQEHYEARRTRHSNLNQVREFRGQALVKSKVSSTSWPDIAKAFEAIGRRTSPSIP